MSDLLVRNRRAGKTHTLMESWRRTGGWFVVFNAVERDRLIRDYKLTPNEAHRVIVAGEGKLAGTSGKVYVDNADVILSHYLGGDFSAASWTGDQK